jgi:hypothetical protein
MAGRRRLGKCAYCGVDGVPITRDHVIPKCLYPATRRDLNLIVVDACEPCNNGFSDDEVHFRTVVALAGKSNAAVKELWDTKIVRSFDEKDGLRRVRQVLEHTAKFVPVDPFETSCLHPVYHVNGRTGSGSDSNLSK